MAVYVKSGGKLVSLDIHNIKEELEAVAEKASYEVRPKEFREEDKIEIARIAKIREALLEKNLRKNEMGKTKRSVIQQMTSLYNRHLRKK